MSQEIKVIGQKVVAGIPDWLFDNLPALRDLRTHGLVQAVELLANKNSVMSVTARFIPRNPAPAATAAEGAAP